MSSSATARPSIAAVRGSRIGGQARCVPWTSSQCVLVRQAVRQLLACSWRQRTDPRAPATYLPISAGCESTASSILDSVRVPDYFAEPEQHRPATRHSIFAFWPSSRCVRDRHGVRYNQTNSSCSARSSRPCTSGLPSDRHRAHRRAAGASETRPRKASLPRRKAVKVYRYEDCDLCDSIIDWPYTHRHVYLFTTIDDLGHFRSRSQDARKPRPSWVWEAVLYLDCAIAPSRWMGVRHQRLLQACWPLRGTKVACAWTSATARRRTYSYVYLTKAARGHRLEHADDTWNVGSLRRGRQLDVAVAVPAPSLLANRLEQLDQGGHLAEASVAHATSRSHAPVSTGRASASCSSGLTARGRRRCVHRVSGGVVAAVA